MLLKESPLWWLIHFARQHMYASSNSSVHLPVPRRNDGHMTMDYHGLPWLFMVIKPWSNMVDHVLLNSTTVFDSGLTPWLTMVFYPWKTMVNPDCLWSYKHGQTWSILFCLNIYKWHHGFLIVPILYTVLYYYVIVSQQGWLDFLALFNWIFPGTGCFTFSLYIYILYTNTATNDKSVPHFIQTVYAVWRGF